MTKPIVVVKMPCIYTKYTYYLFFCVCYTKSVSFIEFLRKFCVYDEICAKILLGKRVIIFERLKISSVERINNQIFGLLVRNGDILNAL